MPDRIVISNTTPIIALALVQRLDLLHALYGGSARQGQSLTIRPSRAGRGPAPAG